MSVVWHPANSTKLFRAHKTLVYSTFMDLQCGNYTAVFFLFFFFFALADWSSKVLSARLLITLALELEKLLLDINIWSLSRGLKGVVVHCKNCKLQCKNMIFFSCTAHTAAFMMMDLHPIMSGCGLAAAVCVTVPVVHFTSMAATLLICFFCAIPQHYGIDWAEPHHSARRNECISFYFRDSIESRNRSVRITIRKKKKIMSDG